MVLMRDDEAWLAQARAGNPDAFIAIVDRYERRIYGFAYHMTGDAAAAAELTRETFLAAYRGLHQADADENLSVWLHQLIAEACQSRLPRGRWARRLLRWSGRRGAVPHRAQDQRAGAPPHREGAAAEQRALGALSPRHRQVLVLREYSGLAYGEIAAIIRVSRSEVAALLLRAREELRERQATVEDTRWRE